MSNRTLTETITYRGKELEVKFTFDKGFKGTLEEPPEEDGIEIEEVGIRYTPPFHTLILPLPVVVIDITEFLGEDQFDEIAELLQEKASDAATEREIDRAEAAEDRRHYGNS